MHSLESDKAEVRCSAICSYGFLTVGVSALQLERTAQDKSAKLTVERKTVASLKQDLDARISELEQLRKIANRDQPLSPATQRDSVVSTTSRTSRHDHPEEEIAGLKCVSFTCLIRKCSSWLFYCRHIIQELNKENLEFTSQIKLVESDKKLLQEECAELREALRMLESNVDDELKQLDGEVASAESSGDVQKALREAKAKHEVYFPSC